MSKPSVGIIGLGNVGESLGLGLAQTAYEKQVIACDRNQPKRDRLEERTNIEITPKWKKVIEYADITLLCVRTDQVHDFLNEAAPFLKDSSALVCLSAGVRLNPLERQVEDADCKIIRAIANVNVAAKEGFIMILQDESLNPSSRREKQVVQLFEALGHVELTDSEEVLVKQSVVPGCAPAVIALLLEAIAASGRQVGFGEQEAKRMAENSVGATLKSMRYVGDDPQDYKFRIAAPGGSVERVLKGPESTDVKEATASWFRSILTNLQEE